MVLGETGTASVAPPGAPPMASTGSPAAPSTAGPVSAARVLSLGTSDPWVEDAVQQVRNQVDHDDGGGRRQQPGQDDEHTPARDAVEEHGPHTLPREDLLDDHRAADDSG